MPWLRSESSELCETAASAIAPIGLHLGIAPHYVEKVYWWAYVHPKAVAVFERDWLVSAILFGHYGKLRDAALNDLGAEVGGSTLQIACAYGNLTPHLQRRLAPDARLDVVDILPIQLSNLDDKLRPDPRIRLLHGDASSLGFADASYDQVLLFFLLHEQPDDVRRKTLAEALRVVRPGGRVIVVDYHRPARWHLLRPVMRFVFRTLEPYAMGLWNHEVLDFVPEPLRPASMTKQTYFSGLYQKLVLIR